MKREINISKEKIISILQDLIKINSVNPLLQHGSPGEREIAHFIGNYLENLGLEVHITEIEKDRWNCVAILRGDKNHTSQGKNLILNGHTDIVPADAMEIDPYNPEIRENRIYGRGAADMKCGLATMIMVAEWLVNSKSPLKGDLILAFVADEEYSSKGTEVFLRQGYRGDGAIVLEPSLEQLIYTHKGYAWIKAILYGKAAHGSVPNEGINAISHAARLVEAVDEYSKELEKKIYPNLGPSLIHNSLISGGSDISTIPANCEIHFEQRTIPGQTIEDIKKDFAGIIDRLHKSDPEFNATFEVYFTRPPLVTLKDSPIVKSLEKAYQNYMGKKITYSGGAFWTDAALLSEAGIPSILFGSIGAGFHANIEYVEIESLITVTEIIIDTILDFCN